MWWSESQYIVGACGGLRRGGLDGQRYQYGVCPANDTCVGATARTCPRVLKCAALLADESAEAESCSVKPILGVGYNTGLASLDAFSELRKRIRGVFPTAEYVGTTSVTSANRNVMPQCRRAREGVSVTVGGSDRDGGEVVGRNRSSMTDLVILDDDLQVLSRTPLHHAPECASVTHRYALQDVRLLLTPEGLYATVYTPASCHTRGGKLRRCSVARIAARHPWKKRCFGFGVSPLNVTVRNGGATFARLAQTPAPLTSTRNGGLTLDPVRGWLELVDIAHHKAHSSSGVVTRVYTVNHQSDMWRPGTPWSLEAAPVEMNGTDTEIHNNVNPLWIEEWGVFLGIGHRHTSTGNGGPDCDKRRGKHQTSCVSEHPFSVRKLQHEKHMHARPRLTTPDHT